MAAQLAAQQPLLPVNHFTALQDYLGPWIFMIPQEALDKAEVKAQDGTRVTNSAFSGPAILEITKVFWLEWIFAAAFPWFLCCLHTACPTALQPFVNFPFCLYFWFIPVMVVSLICEVLALRWVLTTLVQYCQPFSFLTKRLTLGFWLAAILILSCVTHADLATNGIFLAKLIKTMGCSNDEPPIERIWRHTIEGSFMRVIPGFQQINTLFLVGYLMMFAQPVFCMMYINPVLGKKVEYTTDMWQGYRTYFIAVKSRLCRCCVQANEDEIHHADALQVQAVANRMVSLYDKSLTWTTRRAEEELAKASSGATDDTKQKAITRAYDMMQREFVRITWRAWLINILEKGYMLEAQATIFSISRCLFPADLPSGERMDLQMLFSMILSFMTYMKAIYDALDQLNMLQKFDIRVAESMRGLDITNSAFKRAREKRDSIKVCKRFFVAAFVAMLLCTLHCLLKFVMAFRCEDSLWNIPVNWVTRAPTPAGQDDWGCVDLESVLRQGS